MRLPTNHIALTAIGFVALVTLAPLLMVLMVALRCAKAMLATGAGRPAVQPLSSRWMTAMHDFCASELGALTVRWPGAPVRAGEEEASPGGGCKEPVRQAD